MAYTIKMLSDKQIFQKGKKTPHRGGHRGLRYCNIGLFFMWYFSNLYFNVWYCSFVKPCDIRFFTISVDSI